MVTRAEVPAPEQRAHLLIALTDGLTIHTLAGHHTPRTALSILDSHLEDVFNRPEIRVAGSPG